MTPIPYRPFVAPPRVLPDDADPPPCVARVTVGELCVLAGIPVRVTTGSPGVVLLHSGPEHFRHRGLLYVGIGGAFSGTPESALRTLEVLAHGFHDYAARESICRRGLFVPPVRRGRQPHRGRAMTAAERMRRHRHSRS